MSDDVGAHGTAFGTAGGSERGSDRDAVPDAAHGDDAALGREAVEEHYSQVAGKLSRVRDAEGEASAQDLQAVDADMQDIYAFEAARGVGAGLVACSKGCANPVAAANLQPGERVLDLGSGAGLDVIICAKAVGERGRVFGLDMTDAMLELALENAEAQGVSNVEFIKGRIEQIPLANESIDVVTSNCVINLSEDRFAALAEAHRVLAPGGRLAIADMLLCKQGDPQADGVVRRVLGCVLGALTREQYAQALEQLGFEGVQIERIKVYEAKRLREKAEPKGLGRELGRFADDEISGLYESAIITAHK